MTKGKFELVIVGRIIPQRLRHQASFDAAADAAKKFLSQINNRAAHPAIIYGPGCGPDGKTIS